MLRWCFVCFAHFCGTMRILLKGYIMLDVLEIDPSLSIAVIKIKVIQYICQNQNRSELLKHFRREVR